MTIVDTDIAMPVLKQHTVQPEHKMFFLMHKITNHLITAHYCLICLGM